MTDNKLIISVCHFLHLSHKVCVPTSDIFGIEPILHRRGLQRINLYSINVWHQIHPSLSFHYPPSSSDPEETPNSLEGEISGFNSLLPLFTLG